MWELNGYNDPLYLNVGYAWRGRYGNNPPYPPTEHNYVGQYRRLFDVDKSWIGKQIILHIGSATSNVRVWVNGKKVGYSEDSKLEARFDITRFVKPGGEPDRPGGVPLVRRLLPGGSGFLEAGGIARGVYIYTREKERIEDVNIVAGMAEDFTGQGQGHKRCQKSARGGDRQGRHILWHWTSRPPSRMARPLGAARFHDVMLLERRDPEPLHVEVIAPSTRGTWLRAHLDFGFRTVKIRNASF